MHCHGSPVMGRLRKGSNHNCVPNNYAPKRGGSYTAYINYTRSTFPGIKII